MLFRSRKNNKCSAQFAFLLSLMVLVVGFCFFGVAYVKAASCNVEFTNDVILDLDGLETTIYIASGSKAESIDIPGDTLRVNAICDGESFLLKTDSNKVLQASPVGGTADLVIASSNIPGEHIYQWITNSSVETSFIVGVPDTNTSYDIEVDGVYYGSYDSGAGAEIAFSRTGNGVEETYAFDMGCQSHNVWGYAWSEDVGWISFSCTNENAVGSGINYGVDIDEGTGAFSGYAWSENIGWIKFNPPGPYPGSPDSSVVIDLETGNLSGWARALAGEDDSEDGWDGWIKMAGSNYEVTFNPHNGEFSDYAWSDSVIGWTSFNCTNENWCGTSDYKVMSNISFAPSITNLTHEFIPCSQSRIPVLSWETDAEMPYDYDIRICADSSCTSELVHEEVRNTSSKSWSPSCNYCCNISPYNNVSFGNGTYYAQVRVSEAGEGVWSGWKEKAFTTYAHCYPYPDFTCDGGDCEGEQIYEEAVVELLNTSDTYGGLLNCSWTLPDIAEVAEGYTTSDCNIGAIFSAPPPGQRNQDITLEVTDSENYSCSETKTIEIRLPLPEYREVTPAD